MRSHSDIAKTAGADTLAELTGCSIHAVRSWIQRDSIPSEYWAALIEAGHATADELIASAAAKKAAA